MSEDQERVDPPAPRGDRAGRAAEDGSHPGPAEPVDPAAEALFDAPDPEQERVRELLRAEGARPLTLPDDVAARLRDALAAAQAEQRPAGATVASLGAARDRRGRGGRRWQRALAVAAGVTVLAGGAVAVDQLRGEPATTALTERVPASTKVLETGQDVANVAVVRDLAEETLDDAVVGEPEPAPEAPDDAGAAATGPRLLSAPEEPATTSAEDQRPAAERVLACTRELGVATGSVVSVTFAAFRGDPAAVVVHRAGEEAEAVVVPADCRPGDEPISRVDVPVPDGGDAPTSSDGS